jgi:hypothetical protein
MATRSTGWPDARSIKINEGARAPTPAQPPLRSPVPRPRPPSQTYVSLMVDLDASRGLEVTEDHTMESAEKLWESLPESQREKIQAVAMDMSSAYEEATHRMAPQAKIVHDKFHVAKLLNEAVDQVRRAENNELQSRQDARLKQTRQLRLFAEDNLTDANNRPVSLATADLERVRTHAGLAGYTNFSSFVDVALSRLNSGQQVSSILLEVTALITLYQGQQ